MVNDTIIWPVDLKVCFECVDPAVVEIGKGVTLTKGQHATIMCLSKTPKWTYTLRKLLLMIYTDHFLGGHCAVGKKGSKNEAINFEELGALKGKLFLSCNLLLLIWSAI